MSDLIGIEDNFLKESLRFANGEVDSKNMDEYQNEFNDLYRQEQELFNASRNQSNNSKASNLTGTEQSLK